MWKLCKIATEGSLNANTVELKFIFALNFDRFLQDNSIKVIKPGAFNGLNNLKKL